jgi:aromatic-L-amino-acid/L-tryptophan decarboxylase
MIVDRPPTGVNGSAGGQTASSSGAAGPLSMEPDAMRALGYAAVDALVKRWTTLRDADPWVGADRATLDAEPLLSDDAPEAPEGADAVLAAALGTVLPVAARVDHPRFMAYIPSAPTWPSVVADLLVSGFNVFQGTWQGSAGPSRVELQVLEWFRGWLGMPEGSSGLFTSGGSAANALAVVAARARADSGADFRPSIYLSDQGHSSLERAARIAGIPAEGVRVLPSDAGLRLRARVVHEAIEADRAAGWTPIMVAANGGATSTGIVDPLAELATCCEALGVHFHVDAAYGGFAVLDPRGAALLEGIGRADSVTLDPHKWLFQPFECGCLLVRDPALLTEVFRVSPEYLQDTALGAPQVNFGERGVQLTRSFRALKVWMSVRSFGLGAFRDAVSAGITLGTWAEARIRRSDVLEVVTPAALGIVTWRARVEGDGEGDGASVALHRRIQAELTGSGTAFLSSTRLGGVHALRLCLLNPAATVDDVEAVVSAAEGVVRTARGDA